MLFAPWSIVLVRVDDIRPFVDAMARDSVLPQAAPGGTGPRRWASWPCSSARPSGPRASTSSRPSGSRASTSSWLLGPAVCATRQGARGWVSEGPAAGKTPGWPVWNYLSLLSSLMVILEESCTLLYYQVIEGTLMCQVVDPLFPAWFWSWYAWNQDSLYSALIWSSKRIVRMII